MHDGVYPGLDKQEPTHQFMEVYIVVEWEDRGQAEVPEHGDGVSEDQDQDQYRVEEQGSTCQ